MLTIATWVNNHEVERIELVRIHPTGGRPADYETCTYKLRFYNGGPSPTLETEIKHDYISNNPRPLTMLATRIVDNLIRETHGRTVSSSALSG